MMAAIWGLGDASCNTFPNIMLSVLFTDDAESAFANLKFWQSLGAVIPFATGPYMVLNWKLVSLFGFLWVGVIALIYLQIFYKVFSNRNKIEETNGVN